MNAWRSVAAKALVLGVWAAYATLVAPTPARADDFDLRAARMLELGSVAKRRSGTVTDPKQNMYFAMARYAVGKIAEGNALATEVMDNRGACAMFCALSAQFAYQKYQQLMTPALRQKMKAMLITQSTAGGSTANHHIMYASAAFLSSYTWSEAIAKRVGAKAEIEKQVDQILNGNFVEDDSFIYTPSYLNSFLMLYDFSPDPLIRQKARMALDFLLASSAAEHLTGLWAASSLRNIAPRYDATTGAAIQHGYLYFGSPYPYNTVSAETLPSAISSYRPNDAIVAAATDRSLPYIHRELARGAGWPVAAHKYTYMNQTYAIYSEYDGNQIVNAWRDQYTRWGVLWPGGTFYLKQVVTDGGGDTAYNQTMQHKVTILGVAVQGLTTVKRGITRQLDAAGWQFMQGGNAVYIGYRPFGTGPRAWVVDTAAYAEYPSLEAYRDAVLARTTVDGSRAYDPAPGIAFTNRNLTPIAAQYSNDQSKVNGLHYINSKAVQYGVWPILENPWMKGKLTSNLLTMTLGTRRWVYDRTAYTITEE